MRKSFKIALSLLLVAGLLGQHSALTVSAQSETDAEQSHGMGYVENDFTVDAPKVCYADQQILNSVQIPARYDLRELGRVTPVKDQGDYDTCWAFSAMACIESNLITQGYADVSIDFSEKHLAYYTYNYAPDELGNTVGDFTVSPGNNYLNSGGNIWLTANTLANWEGIVLEEDMPYDTPETFDPDKAYPESFAYEADRYHIDNIYWIPTSSTEYIKRKIMELGACDAAIYYSNAYMNAETNAYCTRNIGYTNHAVVIVGWDDNYSKDNFLSRYRPESDGAWLVRNSWGSDWAYGSEGYFWLSYEDSSFCSSENEVAFYEASAADCDFNIYQYDGSASLSSMSGEANLMAANIFTAADEYETLTSVAFYTKQSNLSYSIQVYTNVSEVPDDGTAAFASPQTGTLTAGGYFSIPLDEPVALEKGEKFSIIISLNSSDGKQVEYMLDSSVNTGYWKHTSSADSGQSFYAYPDQEWIDLTDTADNGAFRIKGITEETVHPRTLTDEETGITITTAKGEKSVTRDTLLSVSIPVLSDEAAESISAVSDTYTAYHIALSNGELEIIPSNNVAVSIPLPNGYTAEHAELYILSEDGTVTKTDASAADGAIKFTAARTGTFIVVNAVPARLPGDVNSDGKISLLDSTILRRYLAGWDGVTISESNADVNGDGEVTLLDSIILRRYLAGWEDVELQ